MLGMPVQALNLRRLVFIKSVAEIVQAFVLTRKTNDRKHELLV